MVLFLAACGPELLPPLDDTGSGGRPLPTEHSADPTGSTGETAADVVVPACLVPLADGTSVCLSEVQSDNDSTWALGVGDFPDWIEVVNTGTVPLDPARLLVVIGDDPPELVSGPIVQPGGVGWYPVTVSDAGERVRLFVDALPADDWEVPALVGDTSFARDPGDGLPIVVCAPSPGLPNPTQATCVDPRERLYTLGTMSDLRVYVGPEGRATLQSSQLLTYYPEVMGRLVFSTPQGDAEFPAVGVSIKGGYGSFRNQLDYQKSSFKIDVNEFESRRWQGLQKIQLNNDVQDQTFAREYLTYTLFRAVGIPAPRVSYARVWLDDVYFGLYTQVEPVDTDFLEVWFGDGSGHLLEAAYGPDFDVGEEGSFEYDGGPDEAAGRALVAEVSNLLGTQPWDETTYTALRSMVDMDAFMANMAVEAAVWHWDGYWTENNYYLYEDPATGLLHILPHGTDQTWTDGWPNAWDGNSRSALYQFCLTVPSCAAMYEQKVLDVADAVDGLQLEPVLDQLLALTTPEWDADPRIENRCCRQSYADATRLRIQTVSASLRSLAYVH